MMGIFRMLGIDEEQVKKVLERIEQTEQRIKRIEDKIDMVLIMLEEMENEREGEENE
jgi:UDP-N-acetylmuramyl pentapeptide synthase